MAVDARPRAQPISKDVLAMKNTSDTIDNDSSVKGGKAEKVAKISDTAIEVLAMDLINKLVDADQGRVGFIRWRVDDHTDWGYCPDLTFSQRYEKLVEMPHDSAIDAHRGKVSIRRWLFRKTEKGTAWMYKEYPTFEGRVKDIIGALEANHTCRKSKAMVMSLREPPMGRRCKAAPLRENKRKGQNTAGNNKKGAVLKANTKTVKAFDGSSHEQA
ncbi:hypothetical protein QBC34DRAFT_384068 [Podospora aff. communis PSN243]|uniref:Uncharacterized protein n=1 Tax=Podospora aff. communis PSN243 TaxID=3040156 RepID=A0AAV9GB71_9PEZI|nr:hypothetical protein QBC34DRAFT_384068 [Podospora aff. communis PSN243]